MRPWRGAATVVAFFADATVNTNHPRPCRFFQCDLIGARLAQPSLRILPPSGGVDLAFRLLLARLAQNEKSRLSCLRIRDDGSILKSMSNFINITTAFRFHALVQPDLL